MVIGTAGKAVDRVEQRVEMMSDEKKRYVRQIVTNFGGAGVLKIRFSFALSWEGLKTSSHLTKVAQAHSIPKHARRRVY